MNRKLHNSLMALSTTGLLLVLGLMAATPVTSPADPDVFSLAGLEVSVERPAAAGRGVDARAAAIDARAKAFEEELRNADDAHRAIALSAAFVAETATEAALVAAFDAMTAQEAGREVRKPARETPRKRRGARSALALPYFSFARGLRGGNGD